MNNDTEGSITFTPVKAGIPSATNFDPFLEYGQMNFGDVAKGAPGAKIDLSRNAERQTIHGARRRQLPRVRREGERADDSVRNNQVFLHDVESFSSAARKACNRRRS